MRTAPETPHWICWPAVAVPVAILLAEADDGREISARCAGSGLPAVIDFHPGSSQLVVADEANPKARMPVVRESRFRRGFAAGFQPEQLPELVPAPAWVIWTRDLSDRNFRWSIIPEGLLDGEAQRTSLCGILFAGIFEATGRAKD